MRSLRRGITTMHVVLVVILATTTCLAGELTGASTYGVQWDAGEWIVSSSTTLDYEIVRDMFVTFDIRTDYSRRAQPVSRYELSLNYYPTLWVLEGWCISAGGVYRARSGPTYFLEVSRPFEWPPKLVQTIWSWFRRE